eukprot:1161474-Pelagomonas_calceolata.AAC.4
MRPKDRVQSGNLSYLASYRSPQDQPICPCLNCRSISEASSWPGRARTPADKQKEGQKEAVRLTISRP